MRVLGRDRHELAAGRIPLYVMRMHQNEVSEHTHEFHELVIILKGESTHKFGEAHYRIGTGDVFLIRPGSTHAYMDTDDLELVNILYIPEQLDLPAYDLADVPGYHIFFSLEPAMRRQHGFKSRLTMGPDRLGHLETMVFRLERELQYTEPGSVYAAITNFMQIRSFIARSYGIETDKATPAGQLYRLGSVISHIERNYPQRITLESLAEMAHMSKSTLNRIFKRSMGCSPVEYVLRIRISRARDLLKQPGMSIGDVAFSVGFGDSNYFSRQFRAVAGVTPREFKGG